MKKHQDIQRTKRHEHVQKNLEEFKRIRKIASIKTRKKEDSDITHAKRRK